MHGTGDEIEAANAQVRQHGAKLRQVADLPIAAAWWFIEYADGARACRHQSENGPHQRGLASAVRPKHADEFALPDGQTGIVEDVTATELDGRPIEFNHRHEDGLASARPEASSSPCIHSWNVMSGGHISVTPPPGIFEARATSTRCWTSLFDACLL